jgi:hypothetical protein
VDLIYKNLDKFQFLIRNEEEIDRYLVNIAGRLVERYGADISRVTIDDVWVITNCEAGTTRGKVNPSFVHSSGEVGLYPLPENIAYWNGHDAPAWNKKTSLEDNMYHFFLYMGHIKNRVVKTVNGMKLYRDLFRRDRGAGASEFNAKVLAGVVHGYFDSGKYRDGRIPLRHLIDGHKNDRSLADMMGETKYKYAGTSIIANREANIRNALERLQLHKQATKEAAKA